MARALRMGFDEGGEGARCMTAAKGCTDVFDRPELLDEIVPAR